MGGSDIIPGIIGIDGGGAIPCAIGIGDSGICSGGIILGPGPIGTLPDIGIIGGSIPP